MNCKKISKEGLIPALLASTSIVKTILGPNRSRKYVQGFEENDCFTSNIERIFNSIYTQSPVLDIVHRAIKSHIVEYGTGGTLLVSLINVFTECAMELHLQPVHLITKGFNLAVEHCVEVLDEMKLDLKEWLDEIQHRGTSTPQFALGVALSSTQDDRMNSMKIAVDIAMRYQPLDLNWYHHIHFIPLVGSTSTTISYGIAMDLSESDEAIATTSVMELPRDFRRVVFVDNSVLFNQETCEFLESIDLIVLTGTMCPRVIDICCRRGILCISTANVQPLAMLVHSRVFESLEECIPTECTIRVSKIETSNGRAIFTLSTPQNNLQHTSVVVSREVDSIVQDTISDIKTALNRLAIAYRDNAMLPGGGASLIACAASLEMRYMPTVDDDVVDIMQSFTRALEEWCVMLLSNQAESKDCYLEHKTRVEKVKTAYMEGLDDSKQFLKSAFYGQTLMPLPTPRGTFKFDCLSSTKAALISAVRVVMLVLQTRVVLVNRSSTSSP